MAEVSENRRGPGARLKAAREEKGWSKADTATRLHLSVSVLDELEEDVLRASVELPFMRGYLRNYAKLLGLSADELVKVFDAQHRGRCEEQRVKPIVKHKHEPFEASSPLGYVVGLGLLLAVGGAYFWLNSKAVTPDAPLTGEPLVAEALPGESVGAEPAAGSPGDIVLPAPASGPQTPAPSAAVAPENTTGSSDAAAPAVATAGEPTARQAPETETRTLPVTPSADAPTVVSALEQSATPPAQTLPEAAKPASTPSELPLSPSVALPVPSESSLAAGERAALAMNFSGDCWIKIEDATGAVLSRGLKRTGHAMTLAGVPPFRLILGNPNAVALTFKGEAVDLSQYPANKVAKLSLGANG